MEGKREKLYTFLKETLYVRKTTFPVFLQMDINVILIAINYDLKLYANYFTKL